MALEASAYAAFVLTTTIAFGLISVSAFILLNALSIKLYERTRITRLMRTKNVYSMRSTQAQQMRDQPPPYKMAMLIYSFFCAATLALFLSSYFISEDCATYFNMISSLLFVVVSLGYTALVVFHVGITSMNFVSALNEDSPVDGTDP